jgi:molecular chaperone DnaK (HSP70)
MKQAAFGIDFGTTNSLVCVWGELWRNEARPPALWDMDETGGDSRPRPHASVVWYGPHDEPVVGRRAKHAMAAQQNGMGHAFISSVKRKLGTETELVGGARKEAWEVASEIFKHLKNHAESSEELRKTDTKISDCVVTIPVDFDGRQRREIRRAIQKAGMRLQTFLHEPFAAMVSHFYRPDTKLRHLAGQRALVFDWGGGTLDVCVVEVSEDGSRVMELAHQGIADRAGDEFDLRMMRLMKAKYFNKSPLKADDVPITGNASARFRNAAENAKIHLSSAISQTVDVPNLFEMLGKAHDLSVVVDRSEFEHEAGPEIQAAEACVDRCLSAARLTPGVIDHVLLVGGTSNIPAVRSMMERIFGARVTVAHEPDAAIARGAAIVAAEGWTPYNVHEVGVVLSDGGLFPVLPAGSTLQPKESKSFGFYCVDTRDGFARLILGHRPRAGDKEVKTLGNPLLIHTPKAIDGVGSLDRINVRFVITEDATLQVLAQSSATGMKAEIEIHDICFGLKLS